LGVGKSTIAKQLARKLNAHHISVDDMLTDHNLNKINEKLGCIPLKNFIEVNKILLPKITKILKCQHVVIDGNFYHKKQINHLTRHKNSKIFTLSAKLKTCLKRDRKRKKSYGRKATKEVFDLVSRFKSGQIIDTNNKSINKVVDEILSHFICWPVPSVRKSIPKPKSKRGFARNKEGGRFHAGTDILADYGKDVVSIEDGLVKNIFLFTYPALDRYNKYEKTYAIAIQHDDGNYALYCEVQRPKLKIGQKVKAGQKIVKVGRIFAHKPKHTMLHFEYHSKLPKKTTKWYVRKRPKGLLSSTKYLKKVIKVCH